jgi:endonuclease III
MPVDTGKADRLARIRSELEAYRGKAEELDAEHWPFLENRPISKRAANKFLLGCLIDYRQRYDVAWDKARRFAEVEMGDPVDLWDRIIAIPRDVWEARTGPLSLHSTSARHRKIRDIALKVSHDYQGNALAIWRNKPIKEVLYILESELESGPQVARMTVGGLLDEGELTGYSELKADTHVCRVLGRVSTGSPVTADEATRLSRELEPTSPWRIDYLLWKIGRDFCKPSVPRCPSCPLMTDCRYFSLHPG